MNEDQFIARDQIATSSEQTTDTTDSKKVPFLHHVFKIKGGKLRYFPYFISKNI